MIEERSDADFIKMMELENAEEYGNDVSSTIQSVRSVVLAYADGRVELPPVNSKTHKEYIRHAPSFIKGVSVDKLSTHPYTAISLAVFFECEQVHKGEISAPPKIEAALAALELEELKIAGFDAKSLERFKTPEGKIPVKRFLDATKSIEVRAASQDSAPSTSSGAPLRVEIDSWDLGRPHPHKTICGRL